MGLDMYLIGKVSTANYSFSKNKYKVTVEKNEETLNLPPIDEISFDAGYWRKANAIHGWFVENVQHGHDDCRSYYVSSEELQKLKEVCQSVLDTLENTPKGTVEYKAGWNSEGDIMNTKEVYLLDEKALELLPPEQGFFFGSYDIDDYYIQDLEDTIEIIEKCEDFSNEFDVEFYYQSSW